MAASSWSLNIRKGVILFIGVPVLVAVSVAFAPADLQRCGLGPRFARTSVDAEKTAQHIGEDISNRLKLALAVPPAA